MAESQSSGRAPLRADEKVTIAGHQSGSVSFESLEAAAMHAGECPEDTAAIARLLDLQLLPAIGGAL